jgi:hypothetical protein
MVPTSHGVYAAIYWSYLRRSIVPRKPFDLMPPNGKAPNHLHLDGRMTFRQQGMPPDARVVGCALANGLPNTIVIFVTSATWPIVPISNLPELAALHIEVIAERTEGA